MFEHFEAEKEKKKSLTKEDKKQYVEILASIRRPSVVLELNTAGSRKTRTRWRRNISTARSTGGKRRSATSGRNHLVCSEAEGNIPRRGH
jgi:hypothetical protein